MTGFGPGGGSGDAAPDRRWLDGGRESVPYARRVRDTGKRFRVAHSGVPVRGRNPDRRYARQLRTGESRPGTVRCRRLDRRGRQHLRGLCVQPAPARAVVLAEVRHVWGSCWGFQVLTSVCGGKVAPARTPEIGIATGIKVRAAGPAGTIYRGKPAVFDVPAHHFDEIAQLPGDFKPAAENGHSVQAAMSRDGPSSARNIIPSYRTTTLAGCLPTGRRSTGPCSPRRRSVSYWRI